MLNCWSDPHDYGDRRTVLKWRFPTAIADGDVSMRGRCVEYVSGGGPVLRGTVLERSLDCNERYVRSSGRMKWIGCGRCLRTRLRTLFAKMSMKQENDDPKVRRKPSTSTAVIQNSEKCSMICNDQQQRWLIVKCDDIWLCQRLVQASVAFLLQLDYCGNGNIVENECVLRSWFALTLIRTWFKFDYTKLNNQWYNVSIEQYISLYNWSKQFLNVLLLDFKHL